MSSESHAEVAKFLNKNKCFRKLELGRKNYFSSNCLPLDQILGGGVPRGSVIEIFGPESSGKCVTADTVLFLPGQGAIRFGEFIKQVGGNDLKAGDVLDIRSLGQQTLSTQGSKGVAGIYCAGVNRNLKLETVSGWTLTGRPGHRIKTLDGEGRIVWRTLRQCKSGDMVLQSVNAKAFGPLRNPCPDLCGTGEVFKRLPLLAALSTVEQRSERHSLSIWDMQRLVIFVKEWLKAWFPDKRVGDLILNDLNWIQSVGLISPGPELVKLIEYVRNPAFQERLRRSNERVQKIWAATIWFFCGTFSKEDLEMEFVDEDTAELVQILSSNLGIRCVRYATWSVYSKSRYKVSLRSKSDQKRLFDLFKELEYPVPNTWRKEHVRDEEENAPEVSLFLNQIHKRWEELGQHLPFEAEDVSKNHLRELADEYETFKDLQKEDWEKIGNLRDLASENLTFDQVWDVFDGGYAETWDQWVPENNEYFGNVFVNHNSTLAMEICLAELSKSKDSSVLWFDLERSLDDQYVDQIGLFPYYNANRFLPAIPMNIDEMGDILEDIFDLQEKKGVVGAIPSLIVVDSLASGITANSQEKDFSENQTVGDAARKWSYLLPRMVPRLARANSTLILLNQIRTFIQIGYGPGQLKIPGMAGAEQESTPGGRAPKFYSDVRLRLQPKSVLYVEAYNPLTDMEEKRPYAVQVYINTVKNRKAQPQRRCLLTIEFGTGVSMPRTIFYAATERKTPLIRAIRGGKGFEFTGPKGIVTAKDEAEMCRLIEDPENMEFFIKRLQWDKADEIFRQSMLYSSEQISEDLKKDSTFRQLDGISAEMFQNVELLAAKAELTGRIVREGASFVYYALSGDPIKATSLQTLDKKIEGDDRKALEEEMQEILQKLKASEKSSEQVNGEVIQS